MAKIKREKRQSKDCMQCNPTVNTVIREDPYLPPYISFQIIRFYIKLSSQGRLHSFNIHLIKITCFYINLNIPGWIQFFNIHIY